MGSVCKQEQMSRMKQVETAIGEADAQSLTPPFLALFLPIGGACWGRGRGRMGDMGNHFTGADDGRSRFADGNTCGKVGNADRITKRHAASHSRSKRCHHGVTRPRDVKYITGGCCFMGDCARGICQHDPTRAQGGHHRANAVRCGNSGGGRGNALELVKLCADSKLEFSQIGGQHIDIRIG